jgi:hypothetical protein
MSNGNYGRAVGMAILLMIGAAAIIGCLIFGIIFYIEGYHYNMMYYYK